MRAARLPIKRLGRVPTEADSTPSVDYAIAPVFAGTGFKVKTADALALGAPMLVAAHAAEGVPIDRALVCDTPREMAARMVEISLRARTARGAGESARARDDTLRERAPAANANSPARDRAQRRRRSSSTCTTPIWNATR